MKITFFLAFSLGCTIFYGCRNIRSSLVKTDTSTTIAADSVSSSANRSQISSVAATPKPDSVANRRALADQLVDMDRLGNSVLFEIDLAEKEWTKLFDEFKGSGESSRAALIQRLEKSDDRKTQLYNAYIRIYKDGRTDWPKVRKEVENTLAALTNR